MPRESEANAMRQYCDLHTHSHYSDGTCTPAEIIRQAEALELSAVALTDHNTVDGLPEFLAAARDTEVRAIAGVEISSMYAETELHIVGLFLPEHSFQAVTEYLSVFNRKKEESNRTLIQNLSRAGYALDYDAICRSHPEGTLNRAVIAAALLEKGYISEIHQAFQGLLSKKQGYYIPPERPEVFQTIEFLRSVDAVPVLAHPFLNLKTEECLRPFLKEAVSHGLAAMETMYPAYSPETAALAHSIAREYALAESGGSDFHGSTKPYLHLGTGRGSLAVPAFFANRLECCK